MDQNDQSEIKGEKQFSRRDFIKIGGSVFASAVFLNALAACSTKVNTITETATVTTTKTSTKTQTETVTASATQTIIDKAGREVVVPAKIQKVFAAVPIGTVYVYTLNADKLVAKNFDLSELEKKYTTTAYQELPVMGTYIVGNTVNVEELLKLEPDVVLYVGIIGDAWKSQCETAQQKLGIPVIMADGSLEAIPETYAFLGRLLGEEQKAAELSEYCRNTIDEAKANNIRHGG
jgi:iron complex transport system substrate-binding protein